MKRRAALIVGAVLVLAIPVVALMPLQSGEPIVRIGLNSNAASVTIRSSEAFTVEQNRTRSVKFTTIVSVDPAAATVLKKEDLQYRMLVELDGGKLLVLPLSARIRMNTATARLEFDNRTYRGTLEVFGNARNTFTVVNELPMEDYLLGVVPNELSPRTFGQLEALKAQAVAARTYIVRNMGQYKRDGFDICNTDTCQVYFGAGTEDPLASQAVQETRGIVAVYQGNPINALYSSTCGGRTEDVENIFEDKLPYLRSVICEYKHPEPKPFSSTKFIGDWKDAVLQVARVSNFAELRSFLGLNSTSATIPSSIPATGIEGATIAKWLRETFYPTVKPPSDLEFLTEQGILVPAQPMAAKDILFRLIDKKSAFEWQQGVLVSWDGDTAQFMVNGAPVSLKISPDAPIYQRVGDERISMKNGMWIGGELFDFRAVNGVIEMAVYRKNFVSASSDRFSRLAMWQVHKTKAELDTAFKALNIGELKGLQVINRGPSQRPIVTEVIGSSGRSRVRALRFRSLLGLRDSLAYFDEERNARGDLIGMSFYGQGWGHGVGMCQVGAFGMALDGATFEQILKTYYTGIELQKVF